MSNMSYCRFRNTLIDLRDCHEALSEMNDPNTELSGEELKAFERMVRLCREIADNYER